MWFRILLLILVTACSSKKKDDQAPLGGMPAGQGGGGGQGGASGEGGGSGASGGASGEGGGAPIPVGDSGVDASLDASMDAASDAELDASDIDAGDGGSFGTNGWLLEIRGGGTEAYQGTRINKLTLADDGALYVTGTFYLSATFESTDGNEQTLSVTGDAFYDGFVARYDSDGVLAWVIALDGEGSTSPDDLVVLSDGDLIIGGILPLITSFGQTSGAPVMLELTETTGGLFYARYTPDGELLWVIGAGNDARWPGNGFGRALVTATSDAFYTAGQLFGATNMPTTAGATVTLNGSHNGAGFIARYRHDGELEWATQLEGGESGIFDVVTSDDQVFVAGDLRFSTTFESVVGAGVMRDSTNAYEDAFIAAYDMDGELAWANQMASIPAGASWSNAHALAIDSAGRVLVSAVGVGSGGVSDTTLQSANAAPVVHDGGPFIAAYSAAGDVERVYMLAGEAFGLDVADDEAFAVGHYRIRGTFTGSSGETQMLPLAAPNDFDGFVVSFDAEGAVSSLEGIFGPNEVYPNTVLMTQDVLYLAGSYEGTLELAGRALSGPLDRGTAFVASIAR